ncbi:hypothetical protein BD414DRAFT_479225 [Trametes punicea]|nr:hypothetical protein BD414DRAFT_479225 [Trametes punicea]
MLSYPLLSILFLPSHENWRCIRCIRLFPTSPLRLAGGEGTYAAGPDLSLTGTLDIEESAPCSSLGITPG